jgi:hypothetical protein
MKRDFKQFPKDDNGEVLWQLRTSGDALADPREIDFSVIFPSKEAASKFAAAFGKKHRPEVERLSKENQPDGFPWHVLVYLDEVPRHPRIKEFEASLKRQAAPLGGRFWGWSATFVPSTDPSIVKELWWSYLGRYEDGLVGSIRLNLGLRVHAPMRALPILVVTGVSYESDPRDPKRQEARMPSKKAHVFLNRISDKRVALVTSHATALYAGAFLYNNEQVDYLYVADAAGLEEALQTFHQKECPGRRHIFHTHHDPKWKEYLNFLYPNEATIEHYREELEELGEV